MHHTVKLEIAFLCQSSFAVVVAAGETTLIAYHTNSNQASLK